MLSTIQHYAIGAIRPIIETICSVLRLYYVNLMLQNIFMVLMVWVISCVMLIRNAYSWLISFLLALWII